MKATTEISMQEKEVSSERSRESERERENSRRRRIWVGWREFNDSFEKWVVENVNCPLIK